MDALVSVIDLLGQEPLVDLSVQSVIRIGLGSPGTPIIGFNRNTISGGGWSKVLLRNSRDLISGLGKGQVWSRVPVR